MAGTVPPASPDWKSGKPASPFQSGGVPDQSWWDPATDGIPLTQGGRIRDRVATRKRKFGAIKRGSKKRKWGENRCRPAGQLQIYCIRLSACGGDNSALVRELWAPPKEPCCTIGGCLGEACVGPGESAWSSAALNRAHRARLYQPIHSAGSATLRRRSRGVSESGRRFRRGA